MRKGSLVRDIIKLTMDKALIWNVRGLNNQYEKGNQTIPTKVEYWFMLFNGNTNQK